MSANKNVSADLLEKWNELLNRELEALPDLQLSALSAWVKDCEDSFKEIYTNILVKIAQTSSDDYEQLHECIVDIYWHLDHIKNHILDAEDGLTTLMEVLANKADVEEEK